MYRQLSYIIFLSSTILLLNSAATCTDSCPPCWTAYGDNCYSYLEDVNIEVPKRTKNRWKATSDHHFDQQDADSSCGADSDDIDQWYDCGEETNSDILNEGYGSEEEQSVEDQSEADGSGEHNSFEREDDEESDDEDIFEAQRNDRIDHEHPYNREEPDDPPLYDGASISESLSTIAIMSFTLRHSLTKAAVQDLLKLINIHLPVSCLPETIFLFSQKFDERSEDIIFHVYCEHCLSYLGTGDLMTCTICNVANIRRAEAIKKGSYFITLSLRAQLKDLMETPSLQQYFVGDSADSLEVNWNCDGMPAFEASKGSVWPIQIIVKKLPPSIQQKHILIQGLWFGESKPLFACFLKPFIEEFQQLSKDGVEWTEHVTGTPHHTKVFARSCSCDSVARCQLQGITQFNGHFGCSWCLHEGKVVPKGRGHVMTYPFVHPETPEPRTQRSMEEQAIRLHSGLPAQEGVKSISPLLLLPEFDIVQGFTVDYMHAACEGVVEQLLNLWTDKANHNQAWYIGNSMDEIDERIAAIVPPSDITRLPRSPSQKAHWKASEFRSWILFYCLPVLKGILPPAFLSHALLLVHALWILLQDSVTLDEISICEIILTKFVIGMEGLYGTEHITYNVHLMLHLGKTVQLWGPLWSNSCFPFEGYNRKIKSLFHGTRYVQAQIAQNFTLMRLLRIRVERLPVDTSPVIMQCIQDLLRGYPVTVKAVNLNLGNVQVLLMGNPQNYEAPLTVKELLQDHFGVNAEELEIHKFSSVVVNGRKFSTAKLSGRREDCYISFDGTSIGVVSAILRVRTNVIHKVVLLISKKRVQRVNFGNDQQTGANAGHICEILDYREEVFVVRCVKEKFLKCVTAKLRERLYCMKLPNCIELD